MVPPAYTEARLSERLRELLAGRPQPSLLLIGPPGTGKTWNLWALVRWYEARPHLGRPARLIAECQDIDSARWDEDRLAQWCEWPGLLLVDDVGYRNPTEWTRRAIYAIADSRLAWQRPTGWATNLSLEVLTSTYGPAVSSRLQAGAVIPTTGEDRRRLRPSP